MGKGRPMLPIERKKDNGTYNVTRDKDRHENALYLSNIPTPPSELTEVGQKFWNQVCDVGFRWGVFAETDLILLGAACVDYERYAEYNQLARNADKPQDRMNFDTMALKFKERWTKFLISCGFTPADRQKIQLNKVEENNEDSLIN